jgi:hypothetical protein
MTGVPRRELQRLRVLDGPGQVQRQPVPRVHQRRGYRDEPQHDAPHRIIDTRGVRRFHLSSCRTTRHPDAMFMSLMQELRWTHHCPDMNIEGVPFRTTDWSQVASTIHPGEVGTATWRTSRGRNVRVRVLRATSPIITELRDGRTFTLGAGH